MGDMGADPQILETPDSELPALRWLGKSAPLTINDTKGQPIRLLDKEESQIQWNCTRAACLRARMLAILLDEMLTRIGSTYRPDPDTASAAFRAEFVSERDAGILARALRYYWDRRYEDAARVALPSIETVIRSLAQATQGSSYVEPQAGRDGRESTLGRLISLLPESLPALFRWDLRTILTDPLGLNLRNVHLHGLAEAEPKHDTAIILCTAARLTLIHTTPQHSLPA